MKPCKRREHLIRPSWSELQHEASTTVHGRVQRLTPAGRWVKDDGVSPGLAFTAGVIAYYPGPYCGCMNDQCIKEIAIRHVSAHYSYGCANGRVVTKYVRVKK